MILGPEVPYLIGVVLYLAQCMSSLSQDTYEDNATCITQVRGGGYIKEDKTKHISPKFFYTHEVQDSRQINVKQIRSTNNVAD